MLRSMYFSVRFDRKADPDIHYICPGGYEMELKEILYVRFREILWKKE